MQISNSNNIGMATLLQNNKTYVNPITGVSGNNLIVGNVGANGVATPIVAGTVNNTAAVVTTIGNMTLPTPQPQTIVITNSENGKKNLITYNHYNQFLQPQQQHATTRLVVPGEMVSLPMGSFVTTAGGGLAVISGANVGTTPTIGTQIATTQGAFLLTSSNNNYVTNRNATITTNLNGFQPQILQHVSVAPTIVTSAPTTVAANTTRYFSQFAPQQQQQQQLQQPQPPQLHQQQQQQTVATIMQKPSTINNNVLVKASNGALYIARNNNMTAKGSFLKTIAQNKTILVPQNSLSHANKANLAKTKVIPALQKIQPQPKQLQQMMQQKPQQQQQQQQQQQLNVQQRQQQQNTVFQKNKTKMPTITRYATQSTITARIPTQSSNVDVAVEIDDKINGKLLIANKLAIPTTISTITPININKTATELITLTTIATTKTTATATTAVAVATDTSPTNNTTTTTTTTTTTSTTTTNNNNSNNNNAKTITEGADTPEVDIVINNVVCSFSVRCHLNLRDIAQRGFNVEYRRENGMVTMKLRKPYTTASVWSSGRITCTGATSEQQAKMAARRYARCLKKLGYPVRFHNFRVVNVLGTCSMPFAIKIVNFSEKYKKEACYEPELHPGVTYKLIDPKATLKIFSTGSITITAASVINVQKAVERIYHLIVEFRKERSPEEMEQFLLKKLQHANATPLEMPPEEEDDDAEFDKMALPGVPDVATKIPVVKRSIVRSAKPIYSTKRSRLSPENVITASTDNTDNNELKMEVLDEDLVAEMSSSVAANQSKYDEKFVMYDNFDANDLIEGPDDEDA